MNIAKSYLPVFQRTTEPYGWSIMNNMEMSETQLSAKNNSRSGTALGKLI